MKLWQYDGLVEGISNAQAPERPTPDKWFRNTEVPISNWRAATVAAIAVVAFAPSLAFTNLGQPEQAKVPAANSIVISVPYVVQYQALAKPVLVPSAPEIITVDKWYRPAEVPLLAAKNQAFTFPAASPQDPTSMRTPQIWVDKLQSTNQYLHFPDAKRWQYLYPHSSAANLVPIEETADVQMAGIRQTDVPYFPARLNQYLYQPFAVDPNQLTLHERITPDKWQPETGKPLFDARRTQYLYPSQVSNILPIEEGADIQVAGIRQTNIPYFPVKHAEYLFQPFTNSSQALTVPERITLDKWFVEPQQPFDAKRTQFSYPALFLNPTTPSAQVAVNYWFRQDPLIHPPLKSVAYLPSFTTDANSLTQKEQTKALPANNVVLVFPQTVLYQAFARPPVFTSGEVITVSKWQPLTNIPLFDVKRWQHLYPSFSIDTKALTQKETTLLSKWNVPQSQPLFLAKSAPVSQQSFIPLIRETITADKWFQEPQQPFFRVVLPVQIAAVQNILPRPRTVTVDSWFRLTETPRFDLLRTQYLFQTVAKVQLRFPFWKNKLSPTGTAFADKFSNQGTSYGDKYSGQGTSYGDKYNSQGTTFNDKFSSPGSTWTDKYQSQNETS